MTMPRIRLRWLVGAAVVLSGIWYAVAPHRAYDALLRALAARDTDALHQIVDFDALKQNFRRDFTVALEHDAASRPDSLTRKMMNMIDPMVETALTAQGLAQIAVSLATATDTLASVTGADQRPVTSFRYQSPVRVDVRVRPAGVPESQTGIFTFTLGGHGWRLTRVWSERIASLSGD